jgi:hypothetical protein
LSNIEIDAAVIKMSIGKTERDEREESSGLHTHLAFDVVGSPRNLARMANLLKQGNVNINLIIKATNAATDIKVESIELPHQVSFDEGLKNAQEAARMPPAAIDTLKAGNTPIRTGDPIVPATVLAGDKPEHEPIHGTCINCGYMASAEALKILLVREDKTMACPVCGLEMNQLEPPSGNGHKSTEALTATEELHTLEANEAFDQLGSERDALNATDPLPAPEKVKRTRKKKEESPTEPPVEAAV